MNAELYSHGLAGAYALAWFVAGVVLEALTRPWTRKSWLWHVPPTVVHEFAHWSVAMVLLARPRPMSLWPSTSEKDGTTTLGEVRFEAHWASAGLVALAPLAALALWLAAAALVPAAWAALPAGLWWRVLAPSPSDWLVALKYPVGPLMAAAALWSWLA